jgi:hypothetical protein
MFERFLEDEVEYRASQDYWNQLWLRAVPDEKVRSGWVCPWISTGSPEILDGNPIFSAYSPLLRRGLRIIQHEPTSGQLEIQAWPDFVGGSSLDPEAIRELVISCALNEAAASLAISLIRPWVEGKSVSFDIDGNDAVATDHLPSNGALGEMPLPPAAPVDGPNRR